MMHEPLRTKIYEKDKTHHSTVWERRRQHEQIIHTEPVRRHDLFLLCQESPRVCAELPIRRLNQLRLGPNAARPVFALHSGEGSVDNVACGERDKV